MADFSTRRQFLKSKGEHTSRLRSVQGSRFMYRAYDRTRKMEVTRRGESYSYTRRRLFGGTKTVNVYNSPDKSLRTVEYTSGNRGINIAKFVLLICLVFSVYRILSGSNEVFSFTNFLYMLKDVPQIDTSWLRSLNDFRILPDIPFISDVLNFFKDIVSVVLFFGTGVLQLLTFILYFVGFIFG